MSYRGFGVLNVQEGGGGGQGGVVQLGEKAAMGGVGVGREEGGEGMEGGVMG